MPIKMSDLKKVLNKGKNPMPARNAIAEQLDELPHEPLSFWQDEVEDLLLEDDCIDRCWVDDPRDWREQIITRESINREIAKVSAAMDKAWQNGSDNVVEMLLQEHAEILITAKAAPNGAAYLLNPYLPITYLPSSSSSFKSCMYATIISDTTIAPPLINSNIINYLSPFYSTT